MHPQLHPGLVITSITCKRNKQVTQEIVHRSLGSRKHGFCYKANGIDLSNHTHCKLNMLSASSLLFKFLMSNFLIVLRTNYSHRNEKSEKKQGHPVWRDTNIKRNRTNMLFIFRLEHSRHLYNIVCVGSPGPWQYWIHVFGHLAVSFYLERRINWHILVPKAYNLGNQGTRL